MMPKIVRGCTILGKIYLTYLYIFDGCWKVDGQEDLVNRQQEEYPSTITHLLLEEN